MIRLQLRRPFLVAVVLGLVAGLVGQSVAPSSAWAWSGQPVSTHTVTLTNDPVPHAPWLFAGPATLDARNAQWTWNSGAATGLKFSGGPAGGSDEFYFYGSLTSIEMGCTHNTGVRSECTVAVDYLHPDVSANATPVAQEGSQNDWIGIASQYSEVAHTTSNQWGRSANGLTTQWGVRGDSGARWEFTPGTYPWTIYRVRCGIANGGTVTAHHCYFRNIGGVGDTWELPNLNYRRISDGGLMRDISRVPPGSTFGGDPCTQSVCPDPPSAPPVPQLACGRTMRDLGGGQWVADVEAIVRNPATGNTTAYKDNPGDWRTSWDSGRFLGASASIPLPPGAQPGGGLRATYTMNREYEVGTTWVMPQGMGGKVTEVPDLEVSYGVVLPLTWAIEAVTRIISGEDMEAGDVIGTGGTITAEAPDGSLPGVPTIDSEIRRLWARCFVNIDPPATPEEAGKTTWVIINLPPDPSDPNPAPTTVEDFDPIPIADSSCGGWSWNPINMAKQLGCFLEMLWQWFVDLPETIREWVVPDLADVQAAIANVKAKAEGKVPFSWIGALFDAFGGDAWAMESPSECEAPLDPSDNPSQLPSTAHEIYVRAALCDGDGPGKSRGATATSAVFTVLIWGAVGGRIWDSAPWNRGKDGGGPS